MSATLWNASSLACWVSRCWLCTCSARSRHRSASAREAALAIDVALAESVFSCSISPTTASRALRSSSSRLALVCSSSSCRLAFACGPIP
eukprot:258066-Pyramimonas_sp.AAC.1